MIYKSGNGVKRIGLCCSLLPANIGQRFFKVDCSPIVAKIYFSNMPGYMGGYVHSSCFIYDGRLVGFGWYCSTKLQQSKDMNLVSLIFWLLKFFSSLVVACLQNQKTFKKRTGKKILYSGGCYLITGTTTVAQRPHYLVMWSYLPERRTKNRP
jgi:hypothetical protein